MASTKSCSPSCPRCWLCVSGAKETPSTSISLSGRVKRLGGGRSTTAEPAVLPPRTIFANIAMNAEPFGLIVEAADHGNWRGALTTARSIQKPATIGDLTRIPRLAVGLAAVSVRAGASLNAELKRIFTQSAVAEAAFPTLFCEAIFAQACSYFYGFLRSGRWNEVLGCLVILINLPHATAEREQRLTTILDELIAVLIAIQEKEIAQRRGWMSGPSAATSPLAVTRVAFSLLSPSDFYPGLAHHFLRGILRQADNPILRHLGGDFTLEAWPELMQLVSNPKRHKELSETSYVWLERVTSLDPETFAPGECDEGEDQ